MQDQNKETLMLLFKLDFKKLTTKNHWKLWNDSCIKKHPDLEQKSKSQEHPTFPLNTLVWRGLEYASTTNFKKS